MSAVLVTLGIMAGVGCFLLTWGAVERSPWRLLAGSSLLAGFVTGALQVLTQVAK